MLERLALQNFQCHKNQTLNFAPGVNVIAGSSDSGKSAILKGLLWLLTNRPQGIAFRSWDCGKGDVIEAKIVIDGREVCRRRNEQLNEYILDGKRFVAMKNEVPRDVSELLNLTPVNMQTQFQSHYLLSSSPGEAARILNDSCDLSIIDKMVKAINGIVRDAKAAANAATSALEDVSEELSKLNWVEEADSRAAAIMDEFRRLEEKYEKCAQLSDITDSWEHVRNEFDYLSGQAEHYDRLNKLEKLAQNFALRVTQRDNLHKLISSLENIRGAISRLGPPEVFDGLAEVERELDNFEKRKDAASRLHKCVDEMQIVSDGLKAASASFNGTRKMLADLLQEVKICPICGSKIGKADVR